ncbi:hypothetical protein [Nocardioides solisilvae]|uniref:hypothetical protein n=1 Tax=Nocardioides solisilvae TaxID=1542435 RepID=UPI0013A595C2|nr:hypothetical protein [Nocardioides solisilvae]
MKTTSRLVPAAFRKTPVLLAPALTLVLALGACGSDDGSGEAGSGSAPAATPEVVDELAAQEGEPCPASLPEPPADATAQSEPAAASPELGAVEEAWVCRYDAAGEEWQRYGGPQPVDGEALAAFERDLAALEPAESDRSCTMELGPRWMLVTADAGDLTGVVVDGFGCREVRVTSLPGERVAGLDDEGGAVPGVLQAPASLLETLRAVGEAGLGGQAGQGGQGGQGGGEDDGAAAARWKAMTERLGCGPNASVFMNDSVTPDAGTTPEEAAAAWNRPGGEVAIDSRHDGRAEASVTVDGEVVVVLALVQHPNGGWSVEGGAEC